MKQIMLLCCLSGFFAINGISQGDSWKKIAPLPGCTARVYGLAFSLNGKGYYGTGVDTVTGRDNSDIWSYDSTTDYWTQVSSLPVKTSAGIIKAGRSGASAFTVNHLAFVTGGSCNSLGVYLKDVWRYNDTTNTWAARSDFPGVARRFAVAASSDGYNRGYFGTGFTLSKDGQSTVTLGDFWEYDPGTDKWTGKPNIPQGRGEAAAFAIQPAGAAGTCIYVTGGALIAGQMPFFKDLWKFDPATASWTQGAELPGAGRQGLVAFTANNRGYVGLGTGVSGSVLDDLYMFDGNLNGGRGAWSAVHSLSAGGRFASSAFVIGNSAFIVGGNTGGGMVSETWQYNADNDAWSEKQNADIGVRNGASSFATGGYGYVVGGFDGGISGNNRLSYYDAFKYDPSGNTWSKTVDFASSVYTRPAFTINNIGYIYAPGSNGDGRYFLWSFNPATGIWSQKATQFLDVDAFFCINNIAYGQNNPNDLLMRYNPATNAWSNLPGFPGLLQVGSNYRSHGIAFAVNGKGYYGLGNAGTSYFKDIWQFDPFTGNWTEMSDFGGGTRTLAVSFVINNYAYAGTGNKSNGQYGSTDFWRYNDNNDTWTRVADIISGPRHISTAFVINNKAYVGAGDDDYFNPQNPMGTHKDFYEYTPAAFTLPVSLLNFTAEKHGAGVLLSWQTAQEFNSAYFTIQRSTDGHVFSNIGTVSAAGASATITRYSYTDDAGKWPTGKLYYRLQQADKDGRKTLSNIAAVMLINTPGLVMYPNPAKDVVYVEGENIKTVVVFDNTGRQVLKQTNTGNVIFGVNVSGLATGNYLVQLIDTKGHIQTTKILKE